MVIRRIRYLTIVSQNGRSSEIVYVEDIFEDVTRENRFQSENQMGKMCLSICCERRFVIVSMIHL